MIQMDKVDKITRSRNMAAVHSKNTKPEMLVRSTAHKLGFRFRLHRKDLPGKPDLVFSSRRIALFVHGCFWHGHDCKRGRSLPATNTDFWTNKIRNNIERDVKVKTSLMQLGWKPVVIWECQTKGNNLPNVLITLLSPDQGKLS